MIERALYRLWYWLTEPGWAAVRFVRGLGYESQHADPWAEQHERISDTLDRIELHHQPGYELGATRVYHPPAVAAVLEGTAATAGHQLPAPASGDFVVKPVGAGTDPEDAPYDERLSWAAAWRAHTRGDENAVQEWLEAGWLADAHWIRRSALAVAA